MKKIFAFIAIIVLLYGCGKYGKKELIDDLNNKVTKSNSYHLTGTLEINRNEEKYTYDVDSSYEKGDYFKVELTNKNNNHKQIILKNKEGVFVLTPSLNKSFKFQSDWPYNNSQIYLLQPIISDMSADSESEFEETKNGYILTSSVNYSTEKDFVKQKVYVDSEKNITKVEVLDNDDNIKMSLNIVEINYNPKFEKDYFSEMKYNTIEEKATDEEDSSQKQLDEKEEALTTAKMDDIVYPMYVPIDTYLSGQDVVQTSSGERVILTFNGESAFTIVQENLSSDSTMNYVYGDPYLILDTVGAITDYSVSWISNGVEYSVLSDTMNIDELITVAQSISVKPVGK